MNIVYGFTHSIFVWIQINLLLSCFKITMSLLFLSYNSNFAKDHLQRIMKKLSDNKRRLCSCITSYCYMFRVRSIYLHVFGDCGWELITTTHTCIRSIPVHGTSQWSKPATWQVHLSNANLPHNFPIPVKQISHITFPSLWI